MTRILIVDDDHNIVDLASAIFEDDEKVEIFTAYDGIEAVEVANANPPNLVILDVTLPGRDGFAVLRLLKRDRRTSRAKVIIITGQNSGSAQVTATKLGADGFLGKPFNPADLLGLSSRLVRLDGIAA